MKQIHKHNKNLYFSLFQTLVHSFDHSRKQGKQTLEVLSSVGCSFPSPPALLGAAAVPLWICLLPFNSLLRSLSWEGRAVSSDALVTIQGRRGRLGRSTDPAFCHYDGELCFALCLSSAHHIPLQLIAVGMCLPWVPSQVNCFVHMLNDQTDASWC